LGKPLGEGGRLAESWEVADAARVANGPLAGQTLRAVDEAGGGALVGDGPRYPQARVPLLIKLSNAEDTLSVQVHPDDEYAQHLSPDLGYPGKSEMYYIIAADPGAGIYYGLRPGVTLEQFWRAVEAEVGVPDLLGFVPVQAGDVLYSPARTIHAIGKGIVYCEIQQNSDLTYRLYDWGRVGDDGKPRPRHLVQAMACSEEECNPLPKITPLVAHDAPDGRRTILAAAPHFVTELLEGSAPQPLGRARRALQTVTVLDGEVTIRHAGPGEAVLGRGDSAAIPATLRETQVEPRGPARLLLAYLPDLQADVVQPLRAAGYPDAPIAALGGNPKAGPLLDALERNPR
jgi:mannose-6-phosphate isomerase